MSATFLDEGLGWMAKVLLGIIPRESLAVLLYNPSGSLGGTSTFADFQGNTLPGGEPVVLDETLWTDNSFPGQGDFTYPVIPYTFTASPSMQILTGYMIYAGVTSTALWFENFETPQVIPPTGGAAFLNLEFIDLKSI